jgi:hypothetical protein
MAAKNPGSTPRRTRKAASIQPPVPPSVETQQTSSNGNLEEQIRRRAYEIFLERGSAPGDESEDWLVAEREVLSRAAAAGHHA